MISLISFAFKKQTNKQTTTKKQTLQSEFRHLTGFHVLSFLKARVGLQICLDSCMLSCFSRVWLFVTLWAIACQAPLSMEFSREEYWSGLQFPTPGHISDPGIKPIYPASPALAGRFFITSTIWLCERKWVILSYLHRLVWKNKLIEAWLTGWMDAVSRPSNSSVNQKVLLQI